MQVQMGNAIDLTVLTEAFNRGFQDYRYATTFTPAEMSKFLEASGVEQADCAVLVDESGAHGLGTALLALEEDRAWCGGLAVAPECRRGGGANRLMEAIEERAIQRGATQLSLEVLTDNLPASSLYARRGYHRQRELLIWERTPEQPSTDVGQHQTPMVLQPASADHLLSERFSWHTLRPCWQRSLGFLVRQRAKMDGYLLCDELGEPMGYLLMRKLEGTGHTAGTSSETPRQRIMDMAVRPDGNVQANIAHLLQALCHKFPTARLLLLNEPKESPFTSPLRAAGFQITERQFEMRRQLNNSPKQAPK